MDARVGGSSAQADGLYSTKHEFVVIRVSDVVLFS